MHGEGTLVCHALDPPFENSLLTNSLSLSPSQKAARTLSIENTFYVFLPLIRPNGEQSGGIVLAVICWSPRAQRRCDQGVVLTDLESLLDCQ